MKLGSKADRLRDIIVTYNYIQCLRESAFGLERLKKSQFVPPTHVSMIMWRVPN